MFDQIKAHYEENKPLYHIGAVVVALVIFKSGVAKKGVALAVDPEHLQELINDPSGAIVFDAERIMILNAARPDELAA